ncbi:MAG: flagellar basal body P-ring protein FlgI [Gammaproteobacteria bacterium]|nr:flagellar basal body P-ring protein FlgI [Gammaproteobacteria bacterium]
MGSGAAHADRVKDVAKVAGVRSNPLLGYGIVVGLNGSGDGTGGRNMTAQSVRNMLSRLGVTIPADMNIKPDNVAAVMIHAEMPPFSKEGKTIDITVSSIGDASSLRGGTLLMAPLRGADNQVYAVAQGNVIVSGFGAQGSDGSSITENIPSAGRIPNGAIIERTVDTPFGTQKEMVLNLNQPDFTTAKRLVDAINTSIGPGTAHSIDSGSVGVSAPVDASQRVAFISMLENLTMTPAEGPARVIINSRTGTIVIGKYVHVLPAAVSHGSLTVTITQDPRISQPAPLSGGETVVVPRTNIAVEEEANRMFVFDPGVSLNEIVRAVNEVGAGPSDLVAILEALKAVGALRAELMVI